MQQTVTQGVIARFRQRLDGHLIDTAVQAHLQFRDGVLAAIEGARLPERARR